MKITYRPTDGPERSWLFRPNDLDNREAELIENVGGEAWATWEEFGRKFMLGSIRAYRAALWLLLRRENPRLRFNDVGFKVDQLDVDLEDEEFQRITEALEQDETIDPEQREHLKELMAEGRNELAAIDLNDQQGPEFLEAAVAEPVGKGEPVDSNISST
jgi:hypothetical protein